MPTPLHGLRAPYTLPSNVVFFHDWRYVNHGSFHWVKPDGGALGLFTHEDSSNMLMEYRDMPLGIRLVAQQARKSETLMECEGAGESLMMGGCVLHEEGKYRLWYDSLPTENIDAGGHVRDIYVRYAESEDGVTWRKPRLGLVERNGSRDNNVVYGGELAGGHGCPDGSCIFRDPSAPPDERYKLFHLGHISQQEFEEFRKKRPDAMDPHVGTHNGQALFGAVSPDGLRWKHIPEPLVIQNSDTHNVCTFDEARGKYVAYCRSWYFDRRTIGRMETSDFRRFPLPEELFWPNATMAPHDLWYANGKTMMPGTTDYHVMFPVRWHIPLDMLDFHLAASPDGIVWSSVTGGPVCGTGPAGAWDAGSVWPGIGMVELPGDRIGAPFAGSRTPHKQPRRPPIGKIAWACWPKDRLVALEAEQEGAFALWPLRFSGRAVVLNYAARPSGFVRVEALGADNKPLPGRTFEQCDVLSGDRLRQVVTWRGQADIGHAEGSPVTLRFRMRSAQLFSVRFDAARP